jgi:hypothetical protein
MENLPGELIVYRDEHILAILGKETKPVDESFLIKRLAAEFGYPGFDSHLFTLHFSLFHSLYNLRISEGLKGFYLHISPIYLRILKMPHISQCSYYYEKPGQYCLAGTEEGKHLCGFHLYQFGTLPEPDFLTDFYINRENVRTDPAVFDKIGRGLRIYASRKKETEAAAELFALARPTPEKIKLRYHRLAMEFHPDKCGNGEKMIEINSAYTLLMEVYGALR